MPWDRLRDYNMYARLKPCCSPPHQPFVAHFNIFRDKSHSMVLLGRASLAHDSGETAAMRAAIVITATTPQNHRVTVAESFAEKG